jgi:hypothetical protein
MPENPYSASTQHRATLAEEIETEQSLMGIARRTFLAWEKLRIIYVGLLAAVTLVMIGVSGALNRPVVFLVVGGAVFANLAYFAGPMVETYLRWLGYRRAWLRWVMFIGGTLFSMILAVTALFMFLFPNQA